jgi:hypothetical protein
MMIADEAAAVAAEAEAGKQLFYLSQEADSN